MSPTEWALLVTLALFWSGSFFFGKVALRELPPFSVALGRVGFAAVALLAAARGLGHPLPRDAGTWGAFLVMGVLNNVVPMSLILWGQTQIASGLASILNGATPLCTVVLAHLIGDERLTPARLAGVLLGVAGVAAMVGPDALGGLGLHVAAELAVLGATVSYACAGLFGRRFRGMAPLVVAGGQVTASTALLLPLALVVDEPWRLPLPGAVTWGAVLGLAVLSTAVGYVLYFRILATAGPSNLLLVTLLIPVSAIALGTLVLGEHLAAGHLIGMGLIGVGLAVIDGRLLRRRITRAALTRAPGDSSPLANDAR
jgi:drug/metabolite transporter (DMT)-like permease